MGIEDKIKEQVIAEATAKINFPIANYLLPSSTTKDYCIFVIDRSPLRGVKLEKELQILDYRNEVLGIANNMKYSPSKQESEIINEVLNQAFQKPAKVVVKKLDNKDLSVQLYSAEKEPSALLSLTSYVIYSDGIMSSNLTDSEIAENNSLWSWTSETVPSSRWWYNDPRLMLVNLTDDKHKIFVNTVQGGDQRYALYGQYLDWVLTTIGQEIAIKKGSLHAKGKIYEKIKGRSYPNPYRVELASTLKRILH